MAPESSGTGRAVEIHFGSLEIRLAESAADLEAVQRLRYRVFYDEMGAAPTPEMARFQRDFDDFDGYCDHLMAIDHDRGDGQEAVVGTYRLIRRATAEKIGHFYSESEYDIDKLRAFPGEILELGRSCVDAAARNHTTLQLLWRGNAAYVFHHKIDLMFGCASLSGVDPDALAVPLSYLHQHHLAPPELRPRALPARYLEMNRLPQASYDAVAAAAELAPLIKGYLRLGGYVGDGAVIDHQFNTTDISVVVECATVTEKYYRHYERRAKSAGVTWKPVAVR
ncbi:MAG: GNAT family N-acetyltransferase [Stellaceae bacterium]